ncbi:MAG TPA: hypothetical protein DEU95_09270 [Chloroflexi bacterium]|nr:hypothetical protein [Chloroflexota bacterium]HBY47099.1 hypothetical protein [Chloroflexota bacterium]HCG29909.1 hypothetical protein [Chloroflexota bacterium]
MEYVPAARVAVDLEDGGAGLMATLKIGAESAATTALDEWGTIGSALDGPMGIRGREVWVSPDKRVGTGIWECDAGRFRASFSGSGEFIQVVSGRMTCTAEDGTSVELGPGDAMTFPPGWAGEWHVHEPLRKLYCEFKPE